MAIRTPIKAIRAKCIDCTNGQNVEIRECPIKECPLWEYRMEHRPKSNVGNDFSEDTSEDEEIITEDISD
jgi:hypothetical protein